MGVAVIEFKATASDAEVVPKCPGKSDDEAYEHPEDGECGFADERRDDHREAEPKFKLRVDERKEVVHEVDVECREELVLRDKRCELVRVLDFENRGEDEHAADADTAERLESAGGKVPLDFERGVDECASDGDGSDSDMDVVAVGLRPNVEEPILIREREDGFGEADFGNANGDKESGNSKENACDNGLFHGRSLQNVCRFFEDFLGADPIDGLGIFDADVVDDGKDDAECSDAEQDNPIQGFEIDESVLIKLLNEFFHVGQYTKKNPLVAGPFVNVLRNSLFVMLSNARHLVKLILPPSVSG